MIKVLLADDHTLVRDGLRHILQSASGFEIAGEAWDSATTIVSVKTVSTHKTHTLEKMQMPNENGLVRSAIRHKLIDDEADI